MEKGILMVTLLVVMALAATACNTVDGVGRDLSSAARGVKDTLPQD